MKVYGIGNPFLDIFCDVKDSFFEENNIKKGETDHVSEREALQILENLSKYRYKIIPGGGAFNTLRALSLFHIHCEYLGAAGKDIKKFGKEKRNNEYFNPLLVFSEKETGKCFYLKSPDNKLTVIAAPGAAMSLSEKDIDLPLMEDSEIIYIEGFIFNNKKLKSLSFLKAVKPKRIYIDCGNPFIVTRYRKDIIDLSGKHTTVIMGTEGEIIAFSNSSITDSIRLLKKYCRAIIIKQGKNGASFYSRNTGLLQVPPFYSVHENTTGCGDLFAAGYMVAAKNGLSMYNRVATGNLCGSLCLKHSGGWIESDDCKKLELLINKLKNDSILPGRPGK